MRDRNLERLVITIRNVDNKLRDNDLSNGYTTFLQGRTDVRDVHLKSKRKKLHFCLCVRGDVANIAKRIGYSVTRRVLYSEEG